MCQRLYTCSYFKNNVITFINLIICDPLLYFFKAGKGVSLTNDLQLKTRCPYKSKGNANVVLLKFINVNVVLAWIRMQTIFVLAVFSLFELASILIAINYH